MNDPHIWWYLSRAAGIVAWLMLTASVLWGIVLATDLFPKWRHVPTLLAMHRWLAGLTFFFIELYTKFFEYFWNGIHKAIFFAILGVSFWLIGRKAEAMWKMKLSR